MPAIVESDDPFEAHARREPLPKAGVRVIVLADPDRDAGERIAEGLFKLLRQRGRAAESVVVPADDRRRAIELGIEGASHPLVLVTSALAPWTKGHLDPLLAEIDRCDHVWGRRPLGIGAKLIRRIQALPWRLLFAVPVVDVHSPCRLHRLDKLAVIPLQSSSDFLDVEVLAKATFLGHIIAEVDVPVLASRPPRSHWDDFLARLSPSRPGA